MTNLRELAARSFRFYRRPNLASMAGAAIATAVLTGALLVGVSVTGSLRDLAAAKLGRTAQVLSSSTGFFREALAAEMAPAGVGEAAPLIAIEGDAVLPAGGARRVSGVQIYGVDSRFWKFHRVNDATPPRRGRAAISSELARELGLHDGDPFVIRLEKPSAIPRESLHGRKEDSGKTIRLSVSTVLDRSAMGEFSLRPKQDPTLAVFVPLEALAKDLDRSGRVNTILFDSNAKPDLGKVTADDLGLRVRSAPGGRLNIETESGVLAPALVDAIRQVAPDAVNYLTYLVNRLTAAGGATTPYSLVTAAPLPDPPGSIVLNRWAADDLKVTPGAEIEIEYYYWQPQGQLEVRTSKRKLTRIVPTEDDRTLAPEYPGITDSDSVSNWDPPFPMNLKLVRPKDEEYWKKYRTTPKAFLPLADGQSLWGSRFGNVTVARTVASDPAELVRRLRAKLDPAKMGLLLVNLLDGSGGGVAKGSTDFGEYFLYFSFFLMISALLLLVLFFQFGLEQRYSQLGMLRAIGYRVSDVRRLVLWEGLATAFAGSLAGVPFGVLYSWLILVGLRTIWRGAVGTSDLTLHITWEPLVEGWLAGFFCAAGTLALAIRRVGRMTPRALLAGPQPDDLGGRARNNRRPVYAAAGSGVAGVGLAIVAAASKLDATAGFFGAGALILVAALCEIWVVISRSLVSLGTLRRLGYRNASWNPARSTLSIALVASASFLLVALESFRVQDPVKGTGGFALLAESQIPIVHDLNSPAGREATGLASRPELAALRFVPFRLRAGEEASCLNLYEPRNPRVIGVSAAFRSSGRFDAPWNLLMTQSPNDGTIPAIGDANSLEYVLHKSVGDVVELAGGVRLKIVGMLNGSVLQGELIIAEERFVEAFPDEQGYRFFLIDGPRTAAVAAALNDALSDFAFRAVDAAGRMAAYHQVENTYLSTFQVLGALGLLLGTAGLGAVLLRNTVERRRELALLSAVGYRAGDLRRMILAENLFLSLSGLVAGLAAAAIAVAPALLSRSFAFGGGAVSILVAVPLIAIAGSTWAIRLVGRSNLVDALRGG